MATKLGDLSTTNTISSTDKFPITRGSGGSSDNLNVEYSTLLAKITADLVLSVERNVINITYANSPYTIADTVKSGYYMVDATDGNVSFILPTLDLGNNFVIKKTDASGNTVTVNSAEGIDGSSSYILTISKESITVIGDDSEYNII